MAKLASLISRIALAATLGLASVPGASADPLAPVEGRRIDLGRDVHGTIHFVTGRDGAYLVTATLDMGPDSTPVRLEAALADGQSLQLSTPRDAGQPAQTVTIRRAGSQVSVSGSGRPEIN